MGPGRDVITTLKRHTVFETSAFQSSVGFNPYGERKTVKLLSVFYCLRRFGRDLSTRVLVFLNEKQPKPRDPTSNGGLGHCRRPT